MKLTNSLIKQHTPTIQGAAKGLRHLTSNKHTLEDLVQIGLMDLPLAIEKYTPQTGCSFNTYLVKFVKRSMKSAVRAGEYTPNYRFTNVAERKARMKSILAYQIRLDQDSTLSSEEQVIEEDLTSKLPSALQTLTQIELEVITAYYLDEKLQKEIAIQTGYSPAGIHGILERAINKLHLYFTQ